MWTLRNLGLAALAVSASACSKEPGEGPAQPAGAGPPDAAPTEAAMQSAGRPRQGDRVGDFAADAVYTDDRDRVIGMRWKHADLAMPVVVLRIQSVPQAFVAFHTPPVSDRGEPHTGEHLLLGKGRKGKQLSAEQGMSLIESTAWTSQTDVVYAWNCSAGKETFFRSVEQYLDALLLPDYTDEEIRREVAHIGVARDAATGSLSIEEKGTIYNEMVSQYERRWITWYETSDRLWGPEHPLSWSSGGEPSAVRAMEPRHIHEFHAAHYHLGPNTHLIVALPDTVPEREFLERLSREVADVQARPALRDRPRADHPIPAARPEADRSLRIVPYPNANEGDVGSAVLAWAPVPLGVPRDQVMGDLLCETLAGGETSTLYKRLMDSSTREVAVDAGELWGGLQTTKVDAAPMFGFDGFPPRNATPERFAEILRVIGDEVGRVAAFADGSAEMRAFSEKALVKLAERAKSVRKELGSPPLFGRRGAGGFWLEHLRLVDRQGGFDRSLTLAPVFRSIEEDLRAGRNVWRGVIDRLRLRETPFATVSVPSRAELEKRATDRAARLRVRVDELKKRFEVEDDQEAIRRYAEEYDAATSELAALEKDLPRPRLVPDVPLTLDPSLVLEPMTVTVPGATTGVPGFRGVFETTTFVETSVSLRLDGLGDDDRVWLPLLPALLTKSGFVEEGRGIPYDQAEERRSREIHSLSVEYALRPSRGRRELRVTASGGDVDEARRAIAWIERTLANPWIAPENLPRLRDLVSQQIREVRATLGGREENWVHNPGNALRFQTDRTYLAASSYHAQLYLLARLEWLLAEPLSASESESLDALLGEIAAIGADDAKSAAARLDELVARWTAETATPAQRKLAPVARRCREMVADMAPSTVAGDLADLVAQAGRDLRVPPERALAAADALRKRLLRTSHARFTLTGSREGTDAIATELGGLFGRAFDAASPAAPRDVPGAPLVRDRMRQREPEGPEPLHWGLVNGAGSSGVFVLSAAAAGLDDLGESTLVAELAGRVFGGQAAHGFFMQTWGAGLAYSNGLSVNAQEPRVRYYAERCPDLVETMKFVTGLVRAADALDDPYLAEYATALTVGYSRESDRYESRTRAAADDIVDGDTPQRIEKYRRAVLALKDVPDLWARMEPHVIPMTGRVLPGVGPRSREATNSSFLVIAPERLIERWERWVKDHEGEEERVHRIHARDFWP